MDSTPTQGHNSNIAAYNEFRAQLSELRDGNAKLVFDYEDPQGNKDARSHVYKLRQTKSAVEKARKEEKASSLEYGRRVDAQAKEIIGEIEEMIAVHAEPLAAIERREKDRIAKHEANLSEIIEAGLQTSEQWMYLPLDAMRDRLAEIEAESISEDHWEEFALQAAQAKETAMSQMREAIAKREQHEAERTELERLRKEKEERDQAEREERIRQEAAAEAERKAKEAAERAKREAEEAAQREREEAERRELELKLEKERAEKEAAEAKEKAARAEREAKERAEREHKEKLEREAEEAAERERNKKHRAKINSQAAACLVNSGVTEETAKQVVTLIAKGEVQNVSISY